MSEKASFTQRSCKIDDVKEERPSNYEADSSTFALLGHETTESRWEAKSSSLELEKSLLNSSVMILETKLERMAKRLEIKQKEAGKAGNELGAAKKELKWFLVKLEEKDAEILHLENESREMRKILAARWST